MIRLRMSWPWRSCHQLLIPLAGAGLGLAGAGLFLSSMDGVAVRAALDEITWWLILPTLLFGCVNFWLRTLRWGVLLGPRANLRTSQLAGIGLTAGLVGLILPARGGDVVKLALASRIPHLSVAQIAAAAAHRALRRWGRAGHVYHQLSGCHWREQLAAATGPAGHRDPWADLRGAAARGPFQV